MLWRIGDLVLTEDGYYGIVVADHEVFLGNGCQEIMDDAAWAQLQPLPINVNVRGPGSRYLAASNFLDLIEGRAPCQVKETAGSAGGDFFQNGHEED